MQSMTLTALTGKCPKLYVLFNKKNIFKNSNFRNAILFSFLSVAITTVNAQPDSNKIIQVITPTGAGGATDVIIRSMLPSMSKALGSSLVVENVAGAGGIVGTAAISKANSGGTHIGVATSAALAANPHLKKKLPYSVSDFKPICRIGKGPYVLAVNASVKVKNLEELIVLSKKEEITFASPGMGSSAHMAQELVKAKTGSKFVHIPYKGTGQAISDTVGGHTNILFEAPGPLMTHIKSGKLIPIAVTSAERVSSLPEIPTFNELGYKDTVLEGWIGLIAPAGMQQKNIDAIANACESALKLPDVREKAKSFGFEISYAGPSDFSSFIKTEYELWGDVVKLSGIKPE